MRSFDKELKNMAADVPPMPESVCERISRTLDALPESECKARRGGRRSTLRIISGAAAAAAAAAFVVLPNVNSSIAHAMEQIPVVGNLVKVVTVRNYFYRDEFHQLDAQIPHVDTSEDISPEAARRINAGVDELTNEMINEFYESLEAEKDGPAGHFALDVSYDVITDTEDWFTLRLATCRTAGSGETIYKYYHVDRHTGEYITLADLFGSDKGWKEAINEDVRRQMREQMDDDGNLIYWIDSEVPAWDFSAIGDDQNFYFSESGEITVVFAKYEVAPGCMGCPEFVISKDVYERYLK